MCDVSKSTLCLLLIQLSLFKGISSLVLPFWSKTQVAVAKEIGSTDFDNRVISMDILKGLIALTRNHVSVVVSATPTNLRTYDIFQSLVQTEARVSSFDQHLTPHDFNDV